MKKWPSLPQKEWTIRARPHRLPPIRHLPLAAADFSGKWKIDGDIQGNPVSLDCALEQSPQDKVTGKCTINGNDNVDVAGAVKSEKVNFSFTAGGNDRPRSGR